MKILHGYQINGVMKNQQNSQMIAEMTNLTNAPVVSLMQPVADNDHGDQAPLIVTTAGGVTAGPDKNTNNLKKLNL